MTRLENTNFRRLVQIILFTIFRLTKYDLRQNSKSCESGVKGGYVSQELSLRSGVKSQ